MEQGIEKKYLNPPLGEDEETKRQRQKEAAAAAVSEFNEMMKAAEAKEKQKKDKKKKQNGGSGEDAKNNEEKKGKDEGEEGREDDRSCSSSEEEEEEPVKQKTCLERWEESLLVCTNLSQVFVHLNTLDQSIAWSKSVLNARCRLCRRKGDAEHMLLCDACDRGHHMYCLKPPIKEVCNRKVCTIMLMLNAQRVVLFLLTCLSIGLHFSIIILDALHSRSFLLSNE